MLGAIYNEQDRPPAASGDIWLKKFSNGTAITHDRRTGNITIQTQGTVTLTADSVLINGNTQINGTLHTTGEIRSDAEVSAPSVKQGEISLGSHVHSGVESGNKTSGRPQ